MSFNLIYSQNKVNIKPMVNFSFFPQVIGGGMLFDINKSVIGFHLSTEFGGDPVNGSREDKDYYSLRFGRKVNDVFFIGVDASWMEGSRPGYGFFFSYDISPGLGLTYNQNSLSGIQFGVLLRQID